MATIVREVPQEVFVHCSDPLCGGSAQERVPGLLQEVGITYRELGSKRSGVERSTLRAVVDEDLLPCPECGKRREAGLQERPRYQNLSGKKQDGLLDLIEAGVVKPVGDDGTADDVAALKRELEELRAAFVAQQTPKRGPGRPPKTAEAA